LLGPFLLPQKPDHVSLFGLIRKPADARTQVRSRIPHILMGNIYFFPLRFKRKYFTDQLIDSVLGHVLPKPIAQEVGQVISGNHSVTLSLRSPENLNGTTSCAKTPSRGHKR
jgi:hypothetical protein